MTASRTSQADDQALERELQGLRAEYERLKEDKVRTEQDLSNLRGQIDELKRRALEEYGTADTEELARLLAEKRAENSRLVEEYRAHVAMVRRELEAIEAQGTGEAGHGGD